MLLSTYALGSGFLLNIQQLCFQEKREKKEQVQVRCLQKCSAGLYLSLAEEEAESPKDALVDSLAEVKAQKVGETLTDVNGG